MPRFSRDIIDACRPTDIEDASGAIRHAMGRGSTRYLAEQIGKSQRQTLRYLNGEVKNVDPAIEAAIMAATNERWNIADVLVNATFIDCGKIEVEYNGKDQGQRQVGRVVVDEEMKDLFREAAAFYEANNDDAAEEYISRAIIGGYAKKTGDQSGTLEHTIDLKKFVSGFWVT